MSSPPIIQNDDVMRQVAQRYIHVHVHTRMLKYSQTQHTLNVSVHHIEQIRSFNSIFNTTELTVAITKQDLHVYLFTLSWHV